MADTTLSPLHRADGSATYSKNGYSVVAAVNGPIEVQRRDELPEEAAVDVVVRPAAGVGGLRERHLESVVQHTLRHVILVSAHPRTLIQCTLQIVTNPEDDSVTCSLPQAASDLPVLPALLQASILALLSTSIPLSMTLTAAFVAVNSKDTLVLDPSVQQTKRASSIHLLAFSSRGDLLVVESEGDFTIDKWEEVHQRAKLICHGAEGDESESEDVSMNSDDISKLENVLKDAVERQIAKEQRWKQTIG
ncbi:MAG: exosome non-catalytic core subunit rrp46 [Alectoria sarmentosa]|nr:MAG: exosome non-catalytic core subunit rrp46 [Alectoria sarmentosa]CAD6580232.1 MAG: exosome non-catalytic core subunit rrp46 [Alectoria sarmentosa]